MKRILLILTFFAISSAMYAQSGGTKVDKFLNNYEAFVNEVVHTPFADFHGDTLQHIERQQHKFIRRYRWHYDKKMSIEQVERFNKLRGRYRRKMNALNRRRHFAATKGWVQGRFERHNEKDTLFIEED
ncbi:MAG: hypothetical protein MJZ67_02700 [Bacteroidales bacterium]|nr:hypothetical protein [Bacteroidales bacterium]